MKETQDLREFSVSEWYERFKHISPDTVLIEIPHDVWSKVFNDEENSDEEKLVPEDICDRITNALNKFNKSVFAKNNWHAPVDARMFSCGNTLQAQSIDDILLYFTTSTTIRDDFDNANGTPMSLVLRKWMNIHPAAEFRCIVVNDVLRGITPRDWPTYYGHFKDESGEIIEKITNFYDENIKLKFYRKDYTFDVVLSYPDKPYLLDFGPLNMKSNLYAFTWKEIQHLIGKEANQDIAPVFRYLESDIGIITTFQKFTACQN